MPLLPIDVLEHIVDACVGYPKLLSSLSLASRILTARTRVNLFHTIHLGTPKGPNTEKPAVRYGKVIPTRCDAFFELCKHNTNLPLYVRVLILTESVWHPTIGMMWGDRSPSLAPVVRSLANLKGFAIRTEGIDVALTPPIAEVFSLVLNKPDMEWIHFSDVRFIHRSNLFRVFMHAAPLRLLSLADISIDLKDQIIPDVPEYIPVRLDTLAVSFEIGRVMEEPIIRNALKRTVPLFDIDHIRCLQLHVYHAAEDMDRVHAWLSTLSSVEDLDICIVPGNQALRWRNRRRWKRWITEHFECSSGVHMSRLQKISVRMRDHDGIRKLAAVLEFIAFAESLTHVTIYFTSARGPLTWLDEEAWALVDDALARALVFPVLERIQIFFGKNSCFLEKLEEKFGNIMPKTADILRITEVP